MQYGKDKQNNTHSGLNVKQIKYKSLKALLTQILSLENRKDYIITSFVNSLFK